MRKIATCIVSGIALFGFFLSSLPTMAAAAPDRILKPIAGSPLVWLGGNRRPIFQPENDLGPVEDSFKLDHIWLSFKPTPNQQADLAALLAEQQDPASPNYHQWLTPEQYADRFGLSPNDASKVEAWLAAQGFQVLRTARGRSWVLFTGTAGQVRAAFQTEIHHYSYRGQTYYANASEPALPAALAGVVLGFRGLDNFRLEPLGIFRQIPAPANPNFTSGISANTFLTPNDFANIYDLQSLYGALDGTGQTIAIMGQTDLFQYGTDITDFRTAAGLTGGTVTQTLDPNSMDPGLSSADIGEASLDVEWSGAVAPNATIIYFYSTDVIDLSLYDAIDEKLAPVISISYGACEATWGASNLNALEQNAERAGTQGQTIIAASGDSGAADCDRSPNSGAGVTSATHGLAVDAPASSPYVTGMGGGEFNEGSGNYWQASQASATASGDVITSALCYIPETAWNDTLSPLNTTNELLAGGGGASTQFPKPAWQTGAGVPDDNQRDVPDLSLNASPLHDPYLVCIEGSCVNGFRNAKQLLSVAGGTSAAAPAFAGIVALINQKMNTPGGQGNINQPLYSMAQVAPAAFHDITTGNNMVPCTAGTTDCPASGELGYNAEVGYDQATGLGSVDAYNLVTEWNLQSSGNLPAPDLSAPTNGAAGVALSPPLGWSQVSGNNGYVVMISPSPSELTSIPTVGTCAAPCISATTALNANSYTPAASLAAGVYYWAVQAIPSSSGAYGAWSSIFSFTTTGGSLPAPTLSAPGNAASSVALPPAFTWSSVAGSAGYRILVAIAAGALPTNPAVGTCGGECALGATTTGAAFSPSTTALNGGTTYYWEVQALAPAGSSLNGAWSSVSSFTSGASDFSLSVSPGMVTIAPGASGTATVTMTLINNLTATPVFSCSVPTALAGVTCTVAPLGPGDTATVTLTASSTARLYPPLPGKPRFGPKWMAAGALLGLALLLIGGLHFIGGSHGDSARANNWNAGRMALGLVLALLLVAGFSCRGGNSVDVAPASPEPESGTVTITGTSTGTSSTTTHSVQISVSVS